MLTVLTHIFVLEVLEKLKFTICSLRQNWGAEGFHNLLYGDILSRKQILGRAAQTSQCPPNTRLRVKG